MKENLLNEMKKQFKPEFLNRIDGIVVFHPLTKEQIRQIVDIMLSAVTKQLQEKEIKLEVTEAAKDFLGEKGYDEVFGARPLRRVIQQMVEDKLSEAVLRNQFKVFDKIYVLELEIPEISPALGDAIQEIEGILGLERAGNLLRLYCSRNLKSAVEKTIKDVAGLQIGARVAEYISKALVDVEGNEIVLKTEAPILPPHAELKALPSTAS
jgi:hypothetical protein